MSNFIKNHLGALKKVHKEVSPIEASQLKSSNTNIVFLDIREQNEIVTGMIPGALHISRGFLEFEIEEVIQDKSSPIIVYCASGMRSLLVVDTLKVLGYTNACSILGGIKGWIGAGLDIEKPIILSTEQRLRYSRHLAIPEVSESGQLKLLNSKVLIVGAGGLGCPCSLYLAAAGIGTIGIIDSDKVELSNLQRQVLYNSNQVGTLKTVCACDRILGLNPEIKINGYSLRLNHENIEEIFQGYDLIIDGSDNFATRYLINDACVKLKKIFIHGSVFRFEGQVAVFAPHLGGACYRCLFPEPPPPESAPSCVDAGVLGVLPGIIGLLQATEAIKIITGLGSPLLGDLFCYNALTNITQTLHIRNNPECNYCAQGKPFPGYVDYETLYSCKI